MLECNHLSVGYGRKTVLTDVSATFAKGRLTGVIGINGCGKSTLLKAILGILPLSAGSLCLDGSPLDTLSPNAIAKKIAYLAQGQSTPEMTVMQLVLHGRFPHLQYPRRYSEADRRIAQEAMEEVGIQSLAEQPLRRLSGGMRQNAYLAMALAQNADYILLDEPTTYLDIAHQLDLMRLLRRLASEGKGIVAVMHDLPMTFDFSDEIVILDQGCVQAQATPAELANSQILPGIFGVGIGVREDTKKAYYLYP